MGEQTRLARLSPLPFVPCREPACLAGGNDAFGVRVPALLTVPLRGDQHVLAHRVQRTAAERTAVGGRFTVLGAADGPPARAVEIGHRGKV